MRRPQAVRRLVDRAFGAGTALPLFVGVLSSLFSPIPGVRPVLWAATTASPPVIAGRACDAHATSFGGRLIANRIRLLKRKNLECSRLCNTGNSGAFGRAGSQVTSLGMSGPISYDRSACEITGTSGSS